MFEGQGGESMTGMKGTAGKKGQKRGSRSAGGFLRRDIPSLSAGFGLAGSRLPGRRRGVSLKRIGSFLGLCVLGAGALAIAGSASEPSFQEDAAVVQEHLLTMTDRELAPYSDEVLGLATAAYARIPADAQDDALAEMLATTHEEARYGVALGAYSTLPEEGKASLLEEELAGLGPGMRLALLEEGALVLPLDERTDLADNLYVSLPEYERREMLGRHGRDLVGALYQGALSSVREGLDALFGTPSGEDAGGEGR